MLENEVFKDISYGMYLVTTKNEKLSGCIINTLSQVTSIKPLISISLNKNNYTNEEIKKNRRFAISIISEEVNPEIIKKFGYFSSKDIDKFKNIEYEEIKELPITTEGMTAYLICKVENIIECETHDVFIGRVEIAKKVSNKIPMTYKYYHEVLKGTSPKNAPTFIQETKGGVYRCTICGHIYDNSKENVKFEELPADWKCPVCGVGKDMFEKI